MKLTERIERIGYKIGQQRHLLSLRDGIVLAMPLILAGSIFIILTNLPINGWDKVISNLGIGEWVGRIINGSFGIMGLVASFGIAKSLAEKYDIDGASAGVLSLSSYLILMPPVISETGKGVPYALLGSKGLFVAILVGLITTEIFKFFYKKNIVIKMPENVPPAVARSFAALIPSTVILLFWGFIAFLSVKLGYDSLFDMVVKLVSTPLIIVGTGIIATILSVIFNSLFWGIGIHGGQIVGAVMNPIWLTASDQNRLAYEAGKELPHIVTSTFMDSIVWMGGGGATIGLAIVMFFFARSKQNKILGKLALPPGLFNINEPLLFGLPVVMNLKIWIPFILAPVATTIVSYYAMYFGLVAKTTGVIIPWATPPIISGYLATGGKISGALLQVVTILLTIIIYYPFFRSIDNEYKKEEEKNTK